MIAYIYLKKNYSSANNGEISLKYEDMKGLSKALGEKTGLKRLNTVVCIATIVFTNSLVGTTH
jgi:hypothetical protein